MLRTCAGASYPHPPLRGTFSRGEKGAPVRVCDARGRRSRLRSAASAPVAMTVGDAVCIAATICSTRGGGCSLRVDVQCLRPSRFSTVRHAVGATSAEMQWGGPRVRRQAVADRGRDLHRARRRSAGGRVRRRAAGGCRSRGRLPWAVALANAGTLHALASLGCSPRGMLPWPTSAALPVAALAARLQRNSPIPRSSAPSQDAARCARTGRSSPVASAR